MMTQAVKGKSKEHAENLFNEFHSIVTGELNEEMRQAGIWVGAAGLRSDATTTVRAPSGEPVVTDGPYAETKEVLFSFYVIDVEDLDAAIAWAEKTPAARYGSVEIHPMVHHEFA